MIHYSSWSFIGMHLFWWLFWVALIGITFATIAPIPKSHMKSGSRALDILRRRYAAGAISTEDYERRKTVLERDEPDFVSSDSTHQHH